MKKFKRPKGSRSPYTYLTTEMDEQLVEICDGPWGGPSISIGENGILNISLKEARQLRDALSNIIDDLE